MPGDGRTDGHACDTYLRFSSFQTLLVYGFRIAGACVYCFSIRQSIPASAASRNIQGSFFTVFSVCNERLNYGRPLCAYILSLKLFHLHALGDYILLLKS